MVFPLLFLCLSLVVGGGSGGVLGGGLGGVLGGGGGVVAGLALVGHVGDQAGLVVGDGVGHGLENRREIITGSGRISLSGEKFLIFVLCAGGSSRNGEENNYASQH